MEVLHESIDLNATSNSDTCKSACQCGNADVGD